MKRFKIIPLLVFVAFLSFSVRAVDVLRGVSVLSGSAYAESGAQEEHEAEDQHMDDSAAPSEEGMEKSGDHVESADAEEPEIEWRDPNDEAPNYGDIQMEVFEDLSERRQELDQREKDLQTREALLKAAEQELDRKYQELAKLRGEIEGLLQQQSEEETERINSLVKIYEGMKPKQAARIFDTLDLDVLMAVTAKMSERRLSPILAAMNPERARTITIMLAEQKQLPTLPQN